MIRVRYFPVLRVFLNCSDRGPDQNINEGGKTTETLVQEFLPCIPLSSSKLRSSDNIDNCPKAFVSWHPLQLFMLLEILELGVEFTTSRSMCMVAA